MRSLSLVPCVLLGIGILGQTATVSSAAGKLSVSAKPFGQMPDGQTVTIFELTNLHGMRARVMEYGAILVSLEVPNRSGKLVDVTLGFDDLASYTRGQAGAAACIGRYANRIGDAHFTLDGVEYKLPANNGKNTIHGGATKRFDRMVWKGQAVQGDGWVGARFAYHSPDGEEGFPGNLDCSVTYTLNNSNELQLRYEAATDKPTVINLTNHAYFNLAGAGSGNVLNHEIMINASLYTAVREDLIPTGEIVTVKGTPLDFTEPKAIGTRIEEMKQTRGYDHCYVIAGSPGVANLAARVYEPTGGIVMECRTTEPGVQFYTANNMGATKGKGGKVYNPHDAYCLETQHFPDSPNKLHFPSTVLRPGEKFQSTTIFKFSTR